MSSKKLGKVCLKAMIHRVVESGERARGAQELLKLGRFDEAMDIAYDIEPLLYEANHLMQSASLLRHADRTSEKNKKAKPSRPSDRRRPASPASSPYPALAGSRQWRRPIAAFDEGDDL